MNTLNDIINHLIALNAITIDKIELINSDLINDPSRLDYWIKELDIIRRPYID